MARRRFERKVDFRPCRKLFVLAVEGEKTEHEYFALFNAYNALVHTKCLKGKGSAPRHVLQRIKKYLKEERLKPTDEAWVVVDRDNWKEAQLDELFAWSKSADNFGMALSNPKFEYWLLLHFEDGAGLATHSQCSEKLRQYLPDYDKSIDVRQFTITRITQAIARAQKRDTPPCTTWPHASGVTTVYRLVSNILKEEMPVLP